MSAKHPWTLHQFKGRGRQPWHWQLISPNGRLVAISGEGYINRKHCAKMCALLFPWIGSGQPPDRQFLR